MWATTNWIGNNKIPEIPSAMSSDTPGLNRYKPIQLHEDGANNVLDDSEGSNIDNLNDSTKLNERIRINVSGMIFETTWKTLNRFSNTLLGNPEIRKKYYDEIRQEYFFDRHRESFEGIIYYYQSNGQLQKPVTVPLHTFLDEVNFFQLGNFALQELQKKEGYNVPDVLDLPSNLIKAYIWLIIEYPSSSVYAKSFSVISIAFIFLSVICFCVETLPCYTTYTVNFNEEKPTFNLYYEFFSQNFFYLEIIFIAWFTFELLIRFFCCPSKKKYFQGFVNIIDIISILPFYIFIICHFIKLEHSQRLIYVKVLRFIRIIRVLRVLKFSRHSKGLQILGKTILASCRELFLLLFFLMVCVVLFATMVYFAEFESISNTFSSIPDSFWWAVVTMTTVGYGDMHPKSVAGKFVGSMCAVVGVLTIALPVPVIVSNFNYFYTKEKESRDLFPTHKFIQPLKPQNAMKLPNLAISEKEGYISNGFSHQSQNKNNEDVSQDGDKRASVKMIITNDYPEKRLTRSV